MKNLNYTLLTVPTALAVLVLVPTAAGQFAEPTSVVLHELTGESTGDWFGWVSDRLSDVTGDGVPDIVVGAPFADYGGPNAGRTYVYSGADGALHWSVDGVPGEYHGASVGDAGDLDGDGVTDVAVGGPGVPLSVTGTVTGRARFYSGATGEMLFEALGEAAGDGFGSSVEGLDDDANGDGVNDVLVGAPNNDVAFAAAGRVYLLSGVDGSVIRTFEFAEWNIKMGDATGSVADLDGDGIRDVVASARDDGTSRRGIVYVFSSVTGAVIHELIPRASARDLGYLFLADIGDSDGDGVSDIYCSDFADSSNGLSTGRAYVFSGATGDELWSRAGESSSEGFGIGRDAGDVNGDGLGDLYIAAWQSSAGAPGAGRGFVLSGTDGAILQTMTCTVAGATAGFDAHGMGDVDGDGLTDYAITAAGHTPQTASASRGVVWILKGVVGPPDCPADLDEPFGVLDLADISAFVVAFQTGDFQADLVEPFGVLDLADLSAFVSSFLAGCP